MKKEGGKLVETTWDEALKTVADKLKSAGANAGIISTAAILNEDAAAISKLASDVVKTKNLDSSASLYADADSMNNSDAIDIDGADVAVADEARHGANHGIYGKCSHCSFSMNRLRYSSKRPPSAAARYRSMWSSSAG